ncbi:MAG: hypothetical protein ACXWUG_04890 [Polyangiales bacterium]
MLFPRRSFAILAVCALPLVVGVAWVGCATASEEPGDVTGGKTDSGKPGEGSVDEDGNPIFDADEVSLEDTGLMCPGVTPSNTCATAIEIATLAVGGKTVVNGAIDATGERWYKVTFTGTDDPAAHPHVKLTSTDPGMVFEVTKSCGGSYENCGDEETGAKGTKDYEKAYRADPLAETGPDPVDAHDEMDASDASDARIPFTIGDMGVIYIHVYRVIGGVGCDYKLDVSN